MPERTDEQTRRVPEVEVRDPRDAADAPRDVHSDAAVLEDLETQSIFAFVSSVKRGGRWQPADQIDVISLLGDAKLDFSQAELPESGMVEIRCMAVLGSVQITVPAGAEIEIEGVPLVGSFEQKTQKWRKAREVVREWTGGTPAGRSDEEYEPPLFRITGFALLGSVNVITR